jgi:Mg2+ and Co2+ transporter CorA
MKNTKIKIFIILLTIASCSHIKIDTPKNESIDTVAHKNQKYLIPIPKSYCRYNPKVKSDQSVLNFLSAEGQKEIISLYEESCEVKEKVISGDLRDSPRSIKVDLVKQKDDNIQYATRKELLDSFYENIHLKAAKELIRKTANEIYEDLKKEKSSKYGFSRKRSEILLEEYKSYANNDVRLKKDKDEYAFYLFYYGKGSKISSYSVQSSTKLYNQNIMVTITRTIENTDYSRSIANQMMQEAKGYMKEFVTLNGHN